MILSTNRKSTQRCIFPITLRAGFFCLFMGWCSQSLMAQRIVTNGALNFNPGTTMAIEVGGGVKEWNGKLGYLSGVYYYKKNTRSRSARNFPTQLVKATINYATDKRFDLNHTAIVTDFMWGYMPFNFGDILYPSLILGASVSMDKATSSNAAVLTEATKDLTEFKAGVVGGIELMCFLGNNPRWAAVLHADTRFLAGTFWGDRRGYYSFGIRYHLSDIKRVHFR